jgi:SnoaL-like protein
VDRCDAELVASVYHPDGTDDHGSFKGLGSDFAVYATTRLPARYRATQHTIANTVIDFVDGDVAHVESHVCARHLRDDGDDVLAMETFFGRYVDRFERRDGTWKIAERLLVHDWDLAEPVTPAFPPGRYTEGARGAADASYRGSGRGHED